MFCFLFCFASFHCECFSTELQMVNILHVFLSSVFFALMLVEISSISWATPVCLFMSSLNEIEADSLSVRGEAELGESP